MSQPQTWRSHPIVYEINTRVWLAELSRARGEYINLGNVPEDEIERLQQLGLDGLWMMGVWSPSPTSRQIALDHSGLGSEYRRALADLREEDVIGSPFAVYRYEVSDLLGGREGLRRFREQLAARSLRLMLDFVPNHLAVDHPWTATHPGYLVQCGRTGNLVGAMRLEEWTRSDRRSHRMFSSGNGCFTREVGGQTFRFAHGRDPYFPPWTDTVQVDYASAEARAEMEEMLHTIASQCDGVRCDMAMLVTNDVFHRVWGLGSRPSDFPQGEFWETAISTVKSRYPEFLFLGEVYWGLEQELQRQGFTYTYDKGLYDLLASGRATDILVHLQRDGGLQRRSARFIENHDEQRAAAAFARDRSMAAALLVATLPGLRLFHQGQFEGRQIRLPVQLGRLPAETPDPAMKRFYHRLLSAASQPLFHDGRWQLLKSTRAWSGNGSHRNIIAYMWHASDGPTAGARALVAVNFSEDRSQAVIPLSWPGLDQANWLFRELLDTDESHPTTYHRDGKSLLADGLYVELEPYAFHFLSTQTGPTADACTRAADACTHARGQAPE